jgi:outer membrane protein assembly factor BamB
VSRVFQLLLILIFITSCSFDKKSKFWSKETLVTKKIQNKKKLSKKKESIDKEFNLNLEINLESKLNDNSISDNSNNIGRVNYSNIPESKLRFKYSKIKNFYEYEPEIIFDKNNIIFFDNKGTILKFDNNSNLLWKKNYYSKNEKKLSPILFFASNQKFLIITDTIAKFYVLDINTGDLLWSKKHSAPFNSQVKIHDGMFFVVDFENRLKGYFISNGEETLSIKTENSLIRSQKKISLAIVDNNIFFNNSLGDISSVNIESKNLVWQTPTQNNLVFNDSFFLKTSNLVTDDNNLYFSNNKNKFYSIDLKTGNPNWLQEISSVLRPILVNDLIFTITLKGYIVVIEKQTGNIIRINDIFKGNNINKKKNVEPTGFIIGKNSFFVTTSNGRLLEVDIKSGQTKSIIKIDDNKINKPYILNKDMYLITDNSIIKLK